MQGIDLTPIIAALVSGACTLVAVCMSAYINRMLMDRSRARKRRSKSRSRSS